MSEDITIETTTDFLAKLQPIYWKWGTSEKYSYGYKVEDIKNIFPDDTYDIIYKQDNGKETINYYQFIPFLHKKCNELQEELDTVELSLYNDDKTIPMKLSSVIGGILYEIKKLILELQAELDTVELSLYHDSEIIPMSLDDVKNVVDDKEGTILYEIKKLIYCIVTELDTIKLSLYNNENENEEPMKLKNVIGGILYEIKIELDNLNKEISNLNKEISDIKNDISDIKKEIESIKSSATN